MNAQRHIEWDATRDFGKMSRKDIMELESIAERAGNREEIKKRIHWDSDDNFCDWLLTGKVK